MLQQVAPHREGPLLDGNVQLAGKKRNLDPVWKLLNKEVDLGEPTSFVDHVK